MIKFLLLSKFVARMRFSFIGILFSLFLSFLSTTPLYADATLFLATGSTTVFVDSVVSIDLFVNSKSKNVNSYSTTINFDPAYLSPYQVMTNGSICTIFIKPPTISNNTASVICGQPTPGYKGSLGKIATVSFRPLKQGTTSLSQTGSRVLANDGFGTDVLTSATGLKLTIIKPEGVIDAPKITSSTGESGKWTNDSKATLSWNLPENAKGFSYLLTQDHNQKPQSGIKTTDRSVSFNNLEDGTYYFYLIASDGVRQSPISTYVLMIDRTPPESLDIQLDPCTAKVSTSYGAQGTPDRCVIYLTPDPDDLVRIDAAPIIGFSGYDETSGVIRYEMSINAQPFFTTSSPYIFSEIESGLYTIRIRAYDAAGNYSEQKISFQVIDIPSPTILEPIQNETLSSNKGFMLSGKALRNSTVLVYLNGEMIGSTQSDARGDFSFFINSLLSPGEHTISARVKNIDGIISPESTLLTITLQYGLSPVTGFRDSGYIVYTMLGCVSSLFVILLLFLLVKRRRRKNKEESELVTEISLD